MPGPQASRKRLFTMHNRAGYVRPLQPSGREDALFFQLLLDLRQILFDKHKAQAHQQQRAGKPDRPLAEDADALCADARTQRKDKDMAK